MKNKKSVKKKVHKSEKNCCQTENGCSKIHGISNYELETKNSYEKVMAYINELEQTNERNHKLIKTATSDLNKSSRFNKNLETTLVKSREAIQDMLKGLKSHPQKSNLTDKIKNFEKDDFVQEMLKLQSKNEKLSDAAMKYNDMLENSMSEVLTLTNKLDEANIERNKLHDSWKSKVGELLIENNDTVNQLEAKIKLLERQNESYKASAKQASEVLEQQHREFAKIPALESELKLKNDLNRDFKAKIRLLDAELKESKMDECPICFEATSIERKWTAFLPCGHRTCSECADKISALPRNTNRRKCPNCRENINCFLVLEGIYEG